MAEDATTNIFDRVDRYSGVTGDYKNFSVCVEIPEDNGADYSIQVMAITAVALLSRWCNFIHIRSNNTVCPAGKYKSKKMNDVFRLLSSGRKECILQINGETSVCMANLVVGPSGTSRINERYWIAANGWLAGYGYNTTPVASSNKAEENNMLAAAFAACLGVAELFRVANGDKPAAFSRWYSLFDFMTSDSPAELANPQGVFKEDHSIGNLLQVGTGAVGSNFLFFLALTGWKASINLVDFDDIAVENTPNSLLFTENMAGEKKIFACDKFLAETNVAVTRYDSDYRQYKNNGAEKMPPDIVLCFGNERNIWPDIQYNMPPLTFHATTNKNWGINFGRHIPIKEWCLVCRFESEVPRKEELIMRCSEGKVKDQQTGKEIIAMLPFLSAASALLVLVELAKLNLPQYPVNENFIQFSFRGREANFLLIPNKKKPCYVCEHQDPDIYKQLRQKTKYWQLSA